MTVVGWAATVVGLIAGGALIATPISEASAWLALIFAGAFLTAAWGFGAFSSVGGRGVSRGPQPRSLPPTVRHRPVSEYLSRLDELDGVGSREDVR